MAIKLKPKKIITCAMLIAMYVVLSLLSINLGNFKITLDSLPIIVGAVLFGPSVGIIIGLLGSFLNQMLTFGITATTILWIIPAGVRGLMVGLYAKHKGYDLTRRDLIFILVTSALVVTTVNTASMYIDSIIYGYYNFTYIFGTLIMRYITGAITAVVFANIVPPLIRHLKKNVTDLR